jgi:hypothetical protein
MGKRGLLGGIIGAIGGAAIGGPIGALAGAALVGGAAKKTEPRYVTVREHERRVGGCFIATACYGRGSDEVKIFRNFRDRTLMKNSFGRSFVKAYYATSPPIAHFISDKPFLKKIVRASLWPLKELVD